MGNRKWEIADKKAQNDLLMRCIRGKVNKVKFRLTFVNCCSLNTDMT